MTNEFKVLPPSKGIDANWHVVNSGDTVVAHCFGFCHSVEDGKGFAERIALCLNACDGISDEELSKKIRFPCRECEHIKIEKLESRKDGSYVCSKTENLRFVGDIKSRPKWCPLND